jgi:hypothetical protein
MTTESKLLWGDRKPSSRADGVAQVVERLPSRCEALNSNPSTAGKRKRERNKEGNPASTI